MAVEPIAFDDLIEFVRRQAPDENSLHLLGRSILVSQRLADQADHLIGYFVDQARRSGSSWTEIGECMGVSKQAAQQRFIPSLADQPRAIDATLFDRFTERARRAIASAQRGAYRMRMNQIGTEHLLLGLVSESEGLAAKALAAQGVTQTEVRAALGAPGPLSAGRNPGDPAFGAQAKRVLRLAVREGLSLGNRQSRTEHYVGTEHILLAMLAEGGSGGAAVLSELGVDEERTRVWINSALDEILGERRGGG